MSIASSLSLLDLVYLAPAAGNTSYAAAQRAVGGVRVGLLSDRCEDPSCPPEEWEETSPASGDLQLCNPDEFLRQACGPMLHADVMFSAGSIEEDLFGKGMEVLHMTLRFALPICLGPDLRVTIDAVRDISRFSKVVFTTLSAAQPRVLGTNGLAAAALTEWAKCLCSMSGTQTLVYAKMDGILERDGLLQRLLSILPKGIRGLDFHYLDSRVQAFPVYMLPRDCIAFGTIGLHCLTDRIDCSMTFEHFLQDFPKFPSHISIVRFMLGVHHPWRFTAEEIGAVLKAKFPGLTIAQLEISLQSFTSKKGIDVSDSPFIGLVRCLIAAGISVEIPVLDCRANQFEFMRAALHHAGAAVHQLDDYLPVYPFSHPKYNWPSVASCRQSACFTSDKY